MVKDCRPIESLLKDVKDHNCSGAFAELQDRISSMKAQLKTNKGLKEAYGELLIVAKALAYDIQKHRMESQHPHNIRLMSETRQARNTLEELARKKWQ